MRTQLRRYVKTSSHPSSNKPSGKRRSHPPNVRCWTPPARVNHETSPACSAQSGRLSRPSGARRRPQAAGSPADISPVDPQSPFMSGPRTLKRPANAPRFEQKRALQRRRGRGPLAEDLGRAGHFRHPERRPAPQILRAGDVPLPVGAHPHGPRAQLHHGRRGGALQARHGQRRAAPDGLGRLRHAGGERRHRPQGAPAANGPTTTSRR